MRAGSLTITLAVALLLASGLAAADKPADAGQGHGKPEHADDAGHGQGNAGDNGASAQAAPGQSTHGPAADPSAPASAPPAQEDPSAAPSASASESPAAPASQAGQPNEHADPNAAPDAPAAQQQGNPDASAVPAAGPAETTPLGHDLPATAAPKAVEAVGGAPVPVPVAPTLPAVHAVAGSVAVLPSPAGNRLVWDTATLPDGAQVHVWRHQAGAWVPVATVVAADTFVDAGGLAGDEYQVTWSQQPLDGTTLSTIAHTIPDLVAAPQDGWASPGRWLALLMLASVGGVGLVRSTGPRRILELRVQDSHDLLTALGGLPGVEPAQVDRMVGLGLRSVGQLRRLDPDAVAFWSGLPAATVRRWQDALQLLQWPALPTGVAERLALTGHASLAAVAHASPADLFARVRETNNVDGPGLPMDEAEVAAWIAEARQAIGLVTATVRVDEVPAAKPAARFTWPTAATP